MLPAARTLLERTAAIGLTVLAAAFVLGVFGHPSDARDGQPARLAQAATPIAPTPAGRASKVFKVGALIVTTPWTRATPDGARVAGGFMTITNTGKESDFLIGGSFPIADRFEVHEMAVTGGVMTMREVKGGLEIRPGATVELKPGGFHVMFMDLRDRVAETTGIKGSLMFRFAGTVEVEYAVAPIGARAPPR